MATDSHRDSKAVVETRQPNSFCEGTSYQLLQRDSKASAVKRQYRIAAVGSVEVLYMQV